MLIGKDPPNGKGVVRNAVYTLTVWLTFQRKMLSFLGLLQSITVLPEMYALKEDELTGILVHLGYFSIL